MRKSPCRHHVRSYLRERRPVHAYMRGHGQPANPYLRRTVLSSPGRLSISPNPGIELKELRSPWTGAPLEPAPEYGSSIMYDPYGGMFVMVSVPEARLAAAKSNPEATYVVKPRFTQVDEESLKIAKGYLTQAASEVQADKSYDALEKAYRHLDDAQRIEPWHHYPEVGLHKNPVYVELKQASNYVGSMVDSARESSGDERQKFVDKAIARIHSVKSAIVGNPGGKHNPGYKLPKLTAQQKREKKEYAEIPSTALAWRKEYGKPPIYRPKPKRQWKPLTTGVREESGRLRIPEEKRW